MRYRSLGRTGFRVSEIGFGCWGIGGQQWGRADDREALNALEAAVALGVNCFDTGLIYGNGKSERLLGELLRSRKELYVATKIPPKNSIWPAPVDAPISEVFPRRHIIDCTEASLGNLGVERIDLQQFHVWQDHWYADDSWLSAVLELKRTGKVRSFGVSVNDYEPDNCLKSLATGAFDAVQVIFNIFEQRPMLELFPFCQQHNIGILARVPLDEGGLSGSITPSTVFDIGDWRSDYFTPDRKQQLATRVNSLKFLLHDGVRTMTEAALRFCLSHPAVSTVIPGMRSARHVGLNCAVSDGRYMSIHDLDALKKHEWSRNWYPKRIK
jgi:aryl-alcohol dehydrogenase-like predicted oxidoreductase